MDALKIAIDSGGIAIFVSWLVVAMTAGTALLVWLGGLVARRHGFTELEISEAELGIGQHKLKIRPNHQDVQIAYQLWVEASTRKIGLPIDLEHDVIAEVYDSWYQFFQVTRELIKEVPATKVRASKSTEKLVHIAVEVLNEGIRPHLTTWQARFRRWYERQLRADNTAELTPQELQKNFPKYDELVMDLLEVNQNLIRYRGLLRTIAMERGMLLVPSNPTERGDGSAM